ncbi:MAG: porin [Cyclobacteriaceae bacterium]
MLNQNALKIAAVAFVLGCAYYVKGQDKPLTLYGGAQIWMRYTQLNPGSTVGADTYNETFDISVRRYRLGVKGSPYENISYNLQIGNNNLSRYNKDQPPKLLDAYVSYAFSEKLILTGGKHAWTGLSRYGAPSTFSALGADINYSATPALNVHDDFMRRLAMAIHGRLGKLDYRLVASKPFISSSQPLSDKAAFTDNPTAMNFAGYFKLQFKDKESLSSAFTPWTYLGKKEIFNIGAGLIYQSAATETLATNGDTITHTMLSFAADIFYEAPLGKNTWTFYAAYINHDLGPHFIRYIGANNPASGSTHKLTLNGKGNSFPEAGTGQVFLGQVAILKQLNEHAIQPNLTLEIGDFEALEDPMVLVQAGVNYLLGGHKSKLSLMYQNRPVFIDEGEGAMVDSRKSMAVLQYQIRF